MTCPVCSQPYDDDKRKIADFVGRNKMCYVCYNEQPKIIAIDFDATLTDYDGWKGKDHKGNILDGAREFLEELYESGFEFYIVTSRSIEGIQEWLVENKIDHLIKGITNMKIAAHCYLDDRAIPFNNNYVEALEKIKNFSPWYKNK
jgi:hypothetical protein